MSRNVDRPDIPLVLRLVVRSGDPVTGTLSTDAGAAACDFTGWVELMAAISDARRRHEE
jgi:hypothetical protein